MTELGADCPQFWHPCQGFCPASMSQGCQGRHLLLAFMSAGFPLGATDKLIPPFPFLTALGVSMDALPAFSIP